MRKYRSSIVNSKILMRLMVIVLIVSQLTIMTYAKETEITETETIEEVSESLSENALPINEEDEEHKEMTERRIQSREQGAAMVAEGNCGPNNNNKVTWTFYDDGTLVISPGTGTEMRSDGGTSAYTYHSYRDQITSIVVEDGVTNIGSSAFEETNAASITIADSVLTMGTQAFAKNRNLTSITLSENLTEIGSWAFMNCFGLKDITIPNSVTSIGTKAFVQCYALEEVNLSNQLAKIGEAAFQSCTALKQVTVNGQASTANVNLPSSLHTIEKQGFYQAFGPGLTQLNIDIPATVSNVGDQAFKASSSFSGYAVITVGRTSTEGYGNYSKDAFLVNGSSSNNAKTAIVFPDTASWSSFRSKLSTSSSHYKDNSLTYQVDVNFYENEANVNPDGVEKKLLNKSLSWVKEAVTNKWYYDEGYVIGDTSGVMAEAGYEVGWVIYNGSVGVAVTKDTLVKSNDVKIYLSQTLLPPTVTGTVDQNHYTDGTQNGNQHIFRMKIPDNNYNVSPFHTIGVNVEHALLGEENKDSKGGYVYFQYIWSDVQWNKSLSSPWWTNGPRSTTHESWFESLSDNNYINIRNYRDIRDIDSLSGSTDDGWYEVVIVGWYVDAGGSKKVFYKSTPGCVVFNSAFLGNPTDETNYRLSVTDHKVSVTFELNGGEYKGSSADVVWADMTDSDNLGYRTLGDYPGGVPSPTRQDYVLAGWYDKDDSSQTLIPVEDMASQTVGSTNKTYVAVWGKKINVTYKYTTDDGTTWVTYTDFSNYVKASTAVYNSLLSAPAESPEINGYTFDGWYPVVECTGVKWDFGQDVCGDTDITLYAAMNPITYTIEYDLDGGGYDIAATPNPTTYTVKDLAITLTEPVKAGYIFDGWTARLTTAGVGNVVYLDGVIEQGTYGNLKLTAAFLAADIKITYTSGYDTDDEYTGFFNAEQATKGTYDDYVTYPVMSSTQLNPTRDGYTFIGWTVAGTDNLWKFKSEAFPTALTLANGVVMDGETPPGYGLTLTAKWQENTKYSVTYDANGGSGTVTDPVAYESGEMVTVLGPGTLVRDGYTFTGWNTEPDGNGTPYTAGNMFKITGNVKLFAMWEKEEEVIITKVEVKKADDSGNDLAGAELAVYDRAGAMIDKWTSGEKPYLLEGILKAGETYVLKEISAPDGYLAAGDISFTVNADGTLQEIVMTDKKKQQGYNLQVTKLVMYHGSYRSMSYSFYAALFWDRACTQRASEVAELKLDKTYTTTASFDKLAKGTYYLAETDKDGNVLDTASAAVMFTNEISKSVITLTDDDPAQKTVITNYIKEIGSDYLHDDDGSIKINKKVVKGTEAADVTETFYFTIYADPEMKTVIETKPLQLKDSSSGEVLYENLAYGTYYVAESDRSGVPVGDDFAYIVSSDTNTVTLAADAKKKEIKIFNSLDAEGETEETKDTEETNETEKETPKDTTKESETKKTITRVTPGSGGTSRSGGTSGSGAKTGDGTNVILFAVLLATAGIVVAVMALLRKKKQSSDSDIV